MTLSRKVCASQKKFNLVHQTVSPHERVGSWNETKTQAATEMTLVNLQFFYSACGLCINSSCAIQSTQNSTNHMVHCIVVNCHRNMRLWRVKGPKYEATLVAIYLLLPSSRTSHVHFLPCSSIVTQEELELRSLRSDYMTS